MIRTFFGTEREISLIPVPEHLLPALYHSAGDIRLVTRDPDHIAASSPVQYGTRGSWSHHRRTLQRMEKRDEDFEQRLREVEGWKHRKVGKEQRMYRISAGTGNIEGLVERLLGDAALERQSTVHRALADPLRLKTLAMLAKQPHCVCMMKAVLGIVDSKLPHHPSFLNKA
jgi:hypothetical protein